MKYTILAAAFAVVALLLLAGCAGNGNNTNAQATGQNAGATQTPAQSEAVSQQPTTNEPAPVGNGMVGGANTTRPMMPPPAGMMGINAMELAKHNTYDDCWVAYEGKVYFISAFLPEHPGDGKGIAPLCGTSNEFTNAFEKQHGKAKVQTLVNMTQMMGNFAG